MRKTAFLTGTLFILFTTLFAGGTQSSKIKGTVSSENTKVLSGATIKIASSDNSIVKEAVANDQGYFEIVNLPSNHRYICTVSHMDYQDLVLKNFRVENGKSLQIDFKLYEEENDEIGIETMVVIAD